MRLRAFDGASHGPYTTPIAAHYDGLAPRGLANLQVISQSPGSATLGWDAATDLNFDTYFFTVDYWDRWAYPPGTRHLMVTKAQEPALGTTSTTSVTLHGLPSNTEVYVLLVARDTWGNYVPCPGSWFLVFRTATHVTSTTLDTDQFCPAPSSYSHSLPTSVTVSYGLDESCAVTATVYHTASGAAVKTVATTGQAGENALAWDGRNDYGELVEKGTYTVRIEAGQPGTALSTSDALSFEVSY